ncbi:Ger(x)C family spore germination protein [Brevibacillus sp. M2.1A]|uniref:Ger(x)C family spore germination protein n=1 Tax=Brevibacillus sp. M2.1A TaxID=2738980 RepID=UPI00156AD51F|nr:Ger(x)C family spore germination protein [Brevibacillus sp. M2.1A]MCC8438536.1 Ger(x)C family spore germination protein [Brevibacillus sp. M2.1A]
MRSITKQIILIGVCSCFLTGCWDKVEINQLAVGELVGGDIDPQTQDQIAYFHIVNPEAVAHQKGSGIKAPYYSYRVQAPSIAALGMEAAKILPRRLFPDHYQSQIITERYAKRGLQPFINFFERQYDRRTNLYLFITDSPLEDIMMTYIPLERLSGRSLRSLIEIESETTGRVSKKSRVKDLVENMESSILTVLPMLSVSGSRPTPSTDRYDQISGNQGNLKLTGGAVFKHDKMIGKMKLNEMAYYNLLRKECEVLFESMVVNGRIVDVRTAKPKVEERLFIVAGKPVWKVNIKAGLSILHNEQSKELTLENLNEIRDVFNQQVLKKADGLFHSAIIRGWDLFGLEDRIKYKTGSDWENIQKRKGGWKATKLELSVDSKVIDIGEIINPYKGGK